MIIPESEKDSLQRFMRVEAPSVTFLRTLRMEASSDDSSKEAPENGGDNKDEIDFLKGIDVDSLPPEVVESLKNANKVTQEAVKARKETEGKLTKNEQVLRKIQSDKDRAFATLQKHNLINEKGESVVNGNETNTEDAATLQTLETKFLGMGLTPQVAKMQAQIALEQNKAFADQLEKKLFDKFGKAMSPALGVVGDLHAAKLLEAAQHDDVYGELLDIPQVNKNVTEVLSEMVQQGQTVTPEVIANLADMAYGKYVRETPEDKRQQKQEPAPMKFNTGGNRGTSRGYSPQSPNYRSNNAPVPANQDTAAAVQATVAVFKQGFTPKGGKK